MKNILASLFAFCTLGIYAQTLSPMAQALYNETFASDPTRGNYALTNGAQFFGNPDGTSFYLTWFPPATQHDTLPLIVTLHGSDGNVFNEFFLWHSFAVANNCGIVAVQWYRGDSSVYPNDYLADSVIYNTIEAALQSFNYPQGKALLHGFSRGSARSYAITMYDILSGNNYFCTTMSNAGSAEPAYPMYAAINSGTYGPTPFAGKHWNLYCGQLDTGLLSNCSAMTNTKNWLIAKGATVDMYMQDANGGHGGFQMTPTNVDSLMTIYLQCFYGVPMTIKHQQEEIFTIYPNPSRGELNISVPVPFLNEECTITIFNNLGQVVHQESPKHTQVNIDHLGRGSYYYLISASGYVSQLGKIIVE